MIRTLLVFTTLLSSCLLVTQVEAAWRRTWRGRSVPQRVPVLQKIPVHQHRSSYSAREYRGFGHGGYGYGSGFGPDFRPGRW
ncbi:hypothetical protein [Bremerella alba]|uniref:hypothetical protein n=1 Tax=Bremerella alba TaxID=980252 RepID=UPI001A95454B|nr:hypothetical protein [Bremerella alba]